MKKLIIAGFMGVALFTTSCSSANSAQSSSTEKMDASKLKGDWEVVSIDYDKKFKIKPFDEGADVKCFMNSHWRLIPNNNTGAITLAGGKDCPAVTRPIKFDLTKDNEFRFKKIVDGTKAKANVEGYSLLLTNQAMDQFSLEQNVPFEGENIKVVYNLQRTAMK